MAGDQSRGLPACSPYGETSRFSQLNPVSSEETAQACANACSRQLSFHLAISPLQIFNLAVFATSPDLRHSPIVKSARFEVTIPQMFDLVDNTRNRRSVLLADQRPFINLRSAVLPKRRTVRESRPNFRDALFRLAPCLISVAIWPISSQSCWSLLDIAS